MNQSNNSSLNNYTSLFSSVTPLIYDYVANIEKGNIPVNLYLPPKDLRNVYDISLKSKNSDLESIIKDIEYTMKYSVVSSHPLFMDKLYSGTDAIGVIGELITALINNNGHTYKTSPVFSIMEVELVKLIAPMYGLTNGVMCPGGSYSNLMAMACARTWFDPSSKTKGVRNNMCVFTSEQAHYSIPTNAMILGIGFDNVYKIKALDDGTMDPVDLEDKIKFSLQNNQVPFFINATAGTTVLGAYDDFTTISEIANKYSLWLHIDGSYGGSVIFSKNHRHLMKGCEGARSLTTNPHKMMGIPLQCSFIFVKKNEDLINTTSITADYLFHDNNEYDLGKKSFQCGRRADSFKLWLSIRYYGLDGFENRLDKAWDNARYMIEKVRTKSCFKLVNPNPKCLNVCFWYIPKSFNPESSSYTLSEVTSSIQSILSNGEIMVDYSNLPNEKDYFFRVIIQSPKVSRDHIDLIIRRVIEVGEELYGDSSGSDADPSFFKDSFGIDSGTNSDSD
jgi:glutamate/tyrosine decarboxylase-like PLP-dependent enzyme